MKLEKELMEYPTRVELSMDDAEEAYSHLRQVANLTPKSLENMKKGLSYACGERFGR